MAEAFDESGGGTIVMKNGFSVRWSACFEGSESYLPEHIAQVTES